MLMFLKAVIWFLFIHNSLNVNSNSLLLRSQNLKLVLVFSFYYSTTIRERIRNKLLHLSLPAPAERGLWKFKTYLLFSSRKRLLIAYRSILAVHDNTCQALFALFYITWCICLSLLNVKWKKTQKTKQNQFKDDSSQITIIS